MPKISMADENEKPESPTGKIENFLRRNGWITNELGWALPGKHFCKNVQEAFQCQQVIFNRNMVYKKPKTAMDIFLDKLKEEE